MTQAHTRFGPGPALALAGLLVLSGCDRGGTPPAESSAASAPTPSAVVPQSGNLPPPETAHGPAEGATAIGGPSSNQDGGGAKTGGAPAPTGGDGAAPASSPR